MVFGCGRGSKRRQDDTEGAGGKTKARKRSRALTFSAKEQERLAAARIVVEGGKLVPLLWLGLTSS